MPGRRVAVRTQSHKLDSLGLIGRAGILTQLCRIGPGVRVYEARASSVIDCLVVSEVDWIGVSFTDPYGKRLDLKFDEISKIKLDKPTITELRTHKMPSEM